jgi:hypothetical protein
LVHDATLALSYQNEIIRGLQMLLLDTSQEELPKDSQCLAQINRQLNLLASQFTMKREWAKDILQRAKQAAQLVSYLSEYRKDADYALTS